MSSLISDELVVGKYFNISPIFIFISDPFDIFTIIEILKYFKDLDHLILGVNINQLERLYKDYQKIYLKTFNKGLRHIVLLKLKQL